MRVGLLTVKETIACPAMTDDHNLISHTYFEAVAEKIYRKIREYLDWMKKFQFDIQTQVDPGSGGVLN